MRAAISKHLVKTFQREFETQYPGFSLLKTSTGSTKFWRWRFAPNLHFFVVLQPYDNKDVFTLKIAWSEDGEFPWKPAGYTLSLDNPSWRRSLGHLWKTSGSEPVWSAAPEVDEMMEARLEALRRGERLSYPHPPPPTVEVVIPRIAPLVEDCLQKFREYGLPLFDKVAQARGLGHVLESNE